MTNYTNSALYATSPDAMAAQEMGLPTRLDNLEDDNPWVHTEYFYDREETHVPTREECGEIVFQQIRNLMEESHSQVLTREQLLQIASWALKSIGISPNPGHDCIDLPEDFPR